jgi:transcriptional regulator with XRE-family HTH domain
MGVEQDGDGGHYMGVTSTAGLPGLRAVREAKLITQIHLAELSGVNRSTISDLEVGSRNAHFRTIHQLAAALGVDPQQLLVEPAPALRRASRTKGGKRGVEAEAR